MMLTALSSSAASMRVFQIGVVDSDPKRLAVYMCLESSRRFQLLGTSGSELGASKSSSE
jgi:hypothetical protein